VFLPDPLFQNQKMLRKSQTKATEARAKRIGRRDHIRTGRETSLSHIQSQTPEFGSDSESDNVDPLEELEQQFKEDKDYVKTVTQSKALEDLVFGTEEDVYKDLGITAESEEEDEVVPVSIIK